MIHDTEKSARPEKPRMSADDLAALGLEDFAYVKPVIINGNPLYAIYAADGQELHTVPSRDDAFAMVVYNDLEPVSVH
ncbi:MAG: DUF1150 domain-containing protein [Rhodospirillales bacterium]|nr:DUF1150 domain-containing protein [Rhodospirillales bacterium]